MKYCKNCGSQLNDEAVFCTKCGTQVSMETKTENVNITDEAQKNVQPTGNFEQRQSVYTNTGTIKQKSKNKNKKIIIISVAIALVLCITAGIVFVPKIFSGGAPKVVQTDNDYALFDITFDQFKNGIIKNANVIHKKLFADASIEEVDLEAIDEFNNEDNWTSWTNGDGNTVYDWKYTYSDSDSIFVEIYVLVDKSSNKVRGVTVTSYYADIEIKTLVMSYILFGDNLNDENLEIIANLSKYCCNAYDKQPLLFIDDIGMSMSQADGYRYDVEYAILPLSENLKEEASSSGVWIERDNLYRFDKILSARYDYDYEWNTLDEFKESLG